MARELLWWSDDRNRHLQEMRKCLFSPFPPPCYAIKVALVTACMHIKILLWVCTIHALQFQFWLCSAPQKWREKKFVLVCFIRTLKKPAYQCVRTPSSLPSIDLLWLLTRLQLVCALLWKLAPIPKKQLTLSVQKKSSFGGTKKIRANTYLVSCEVFA